MHGLCTRREWQCNICLWTATKSLYNKHLLNQAASVLLGSTQRTIYTYLHATENVHVGTQHTNMYMSKSSMETKMRAKPAAD